jgi:hypothetical protein
VRYNRLDALFGLSGYGNNESLETNGNVYWLDQLHHQKMNKNGFGG